MSIGTDLLQEWLNLRSSTRRHQTFWDVQKRHRMEATHGAEPYDADMKMLGDAADQAAAVAANCTLYFWGTDPLRAALEASTSLPEDSAILADLYTELPRRGLWIFETPLLEQTTFEDFDVHGLLWDLSEKGLWMVALVRVEMAKHRQSVLAGMDRVGELAPTWTGWFPSKFPDSHPRAGARLTLKDLEQSCREMYQESYKYSTSQELMGEDHTVKTHVKFSKFWLAAAQWMRQRVLVRKRPDRVLPKNKKRARKMAAQVKGQMPTIEMIQLRRTEGSVTQHTGTPRHFHMRFVVHGFWRNQWYASRGVHAPKWIASYLKGPKDAPLKETIRGFAVTR